MRRGFSIGLMPRILLKADASGVSWRRNGLELVGKEASDDGSVDIGCNEDVLNSSYTPASSG
jgi:hypothetical protein